MQRNHQGLQFLSWIRFTITLVVVSFMVFISPCIAQESSIGIDINPMVVESNQNFSVSVYDTSIQNGSPYLVDVTILFNEEYYQILPDDENGEIFLTAPEVLVNKTFKIEAYYNGLQTNTTLLVTPPKSYPQTELVITADAYTVKAYEDFSILITDKNGQPIENVLVIIQESSASKGSGITNTLGKVELTAPNEDILTIRAEKIGYKPANKTMNVVIENDFIQQVLSHPYTPIIGSIIVLIGVICFVTISNIQKKKHRLIILEKKNNSRQSFDQSKQKHSESKDYEEKFEPNIPRKSGQQIEEIHITSPLTKKITQIDAKKCKTTNPSHRWFNQQNKRHHKPQKKNQDSKSEPIVHGSEDIHKKIDAVLAKKEKKSKDSTTLT